VAPYPEHDKLSAVRERSQAIGEFIEWLPSKGLHLAEFVEDSDPLNDGVLMLAHRPIVELLAEFFEIDLNKIEQEKRAMLSSLIGPPASRS